ncbi:MAG: F0F1 ATP synthase subunit epsilon [Patescibacteria group bacterium]
MQATFSFQILTPQGLVSKGEASAISLPTHLGEITILADHVPMVALLTHGEGRIFKLGESAPWPFFCTTGAVQISANHEVTILTKEATPSADLTETAIETAKAAAMARLDAVGLEDNRAQVLAEASLMRELIKLKLAQKNRSRSLNQ